MRGLIEGMPSRHSLGAALPGLYQEDDLAQRLTAALDSVIAPIVSVLDNLNAYVDAWLAPDDFVEWLAGWVDADLDPGWPDAQRRAVVARAVHLHRWRGTVGGLKEEVALLTGVEPEILEDGGVEWSQSPDPVARGQAADRFTVRLHVTDPASVDLREVDGLVAAIKPAHLVHTVEVVRR